MFFIKKLVSCSLFLEINVTIAELNSSTLAFLELVLHEPRGAFDILPSWFFAKVFLSTWVSKGLIALISPLSFNLNNWLTFSALSYQDPVARWVEGCAEVPDPKSSESYGAISYSTLHYSSLPYFQRGSLDDGLHNLNISTLGCSPRDQYIETVQFHLLSNKIAMLNCA